MDGYLVVSGKGSEAQNEDNIFYKEKVTPLIKKMQTAECDDSIDSYDKQLVRNSISMIRNTKHSRNAYSHFFALKFGYSSYVENDNLNKLKGFIKAKFPQSPSIQNLGKKGTPGCKLSELMFARMHQIYNERIQKFKQETLKGAKLELAFYISENKLISLNGIATEYILVDFWASWCRSYLKENPYLKEALRKHKNNLSIYAVSINRFPAAWEKAIKRDNSKELIHIIGTDLSGLPNGVVQGVGIKLISANFLLDKNHCIIAKDLRGERLVQVLDSLVRK